MDGRSVHYCGTEFHYQELVPFKGMLVKKD